MLTNLPGIQSETEQEETAKDLSNEDLSLAHQLAHAFRDPDEFLFIYDHRIPAEFSQTRVNISISKFYILFFIFCFIFFH